MNAKLTFKQRLFFKFFYSFRSRLWGHYFQLARALAEEEIPKIDLRSEHINNLKTLANREELIGKMPAGKVVAEIGVAHGDFSEIILKLTKPEKLCLVDAWAEDIRYHIGLKSRVENKFKEQIAEGVISLNVGFSTDVLKTFGDSYFDWAYLDTDHTYQTTKAELDILKTKVKPNGIIAGHDYTIGNWADGLRYGVIEAVNEFCVNENWEIIFLTAETDQYRSFAIRRILT